MTDATTPRAVRPQPTAVDLSAVDPSHTEAESPEQLLSTAVAETAAGVTGVHHLGGLAARTLDRASRQIRGTSSAPGVTVSDEDGVTTVDLDLVVEYPHPVDLVVDAARDQVSRAASQLVAGTVVINITVTDIHGPYDKDPAVLDAIDSAGIKAAELKDRAGDLAEQAGDTAGEWKDTASAKAGELRSQARDQVDGLKERAGDLAAQASDTAGDLRDQADVKVAEMKERAGVLKEQMSDTADDLRERADDARAQADDKVAEFAAKADEKVDSLREKADAKVDEVSDATSNADASAGVTLDELDAEANDKLDELDAKADEKLDELDDAIDATPESTTRPSGEAL